MFSLYIHTFCVCNVCVNTHIYSLCSFFLYVYVYILSIYLSLEGVHLCIICHPLSTKVKYKFLENRL